MSQSLASGVSDLHPEYHDITELADHILGMVKLTPIKVILQSSIEEKSVLIHQHILSECL